MKLCGISAQIDAEDFQGRSGEERKAFMRDLLAQLEVALRQHIGDTKPQAQPQFTFDGPVPDPSASKLLVAHPTMVYVATYAVQVDENKLPPDCTAYLALGR